MDYFHYPPMKAALFQEALNALDPLHDYSVDPIKSGLINQSYRIASVVTGNYLLLQRINSQVFRDPILLQDNYELIWKYAGTRIPAPKYFPGGQKVFRDSSNNYWRVFEFIEGESFEVAKTISQAGSVAASFAKFTAGLVRMDPGKLKPAIPHFHDLSERFKQFTHALIRGDLKRIQQSSELIRELQKRSRLVSFYEVVVESEDFPLRVMHHDAKISNVIFSRKTGEVICPVDLDTAMPGHFFSDLGDMIRSMSCCQDENSTDFDALCIRKDFYTAIVSSYMNIMEKHFSASEKKYLHHAGLLMIYMQTLRFITDHLMGDAYYKTSHGGQNYERAKNQLTLLEKLEEFLQSEYGIRA
jgi:hypothetical protein